MTLTDPPPVVGLHSAAAPAPLADAVPVVDVVIPVYNEQRDLAPSVRRLHDYLASSFPYSFRITIADNASTDQTPTVAAELAAELDPVAVLRLEQKGRGRALREAWSASDAPVLAYCDVDLSTDLAALLPLIAPLVSGHSDLAIGTRLGKGSRVARGIKREVISRCYNLLLRGALAAGFSDAQCGFKAIRADAAAELLPLVRDPGWFFDTELLVLAERAGLRIHEVPVDWVDDPDSRVDLVATAMADLRGVLRLAAALGSGSLPLGDLRARLGRGQQALGGAVPVGLGGQLLRFAGIGVLSTALYLVLYLILREPLGAQSANLLALLATAIGNTWANRAITFGVQGRRGALRQHTRALVLFGLGLALTGGSLAALHAVVPDPSWSAELLVLIAANLVASALRFVLLHAWVFAGRRSQH
ncbi:MAG TPA: bifunctional glycosyltransferase family 2/GtrA family protein [Pseudonocardia sp.]|uniref:bifunctional glycosyltransferase family 2/GtrA family protein n=1 Tax=Pseudonocardia sp. TaxID=60912 RepID=UPI002C346DBD|nr:bifunctional glycosyltransferase family 2/GtrA family protein [Pseudonocardia sp.]HTF46781.1 bifunctional glycosyltransferase family 2/GtrA family protein [Pseudonocardia sp.]